MYLKVGETNRTWTLSDHKLNRHLELTEICNKLRVLCQVSSRSGDIIQDCKMTLVDDEYVDQLFIHSRIDYIGVRTYFKHQYVYRIQLVYDREIES